MVQIMLKSPYRRNIPLEVLERELAYAEDAAKEGYGNDTLRLWGDEASDTNVAGAEGQHRDIPPFLMRVGWRKRHQGLVPTS